MIAQNTAAPEVASVVQVGFADRVKDFFQVDKIVASLDLTQEKVLKIGIFAVVGFFLGFFLRKYGRSLFIALAGFVVLLIAFEYLQVISINWQVARTLVGLTPTDTIETVFQALLAWARSQVLPVSAGILGFIAGYKVG